MPRNHPHWNTDDWEDPNNGLQIDDSLLDRRDVELSRVTEVTPSGVTQEQIDDFKNEQRPSVDAGGSIVGDINKELEMSDGKSNRVQRVETRIVEHSDSISQLTDASWRAQQTADTAIEDAARANDELGDLLDEDTDNPVGLWRLQEAINEANHAALVAHQAAIEANTLAIESLSRSVTRHIPLQVSGSNEFVSVNGVTVTIKGDWVGDILVLTREWSRNSTTSGGSGTGSEYHQRPSWVRNVVPLSNGGTTVEYPGGLIAFINIRGGTAVNERVSKDGMTTLPDNVWTTALEWTVKENGPVYGSASFDWRNKTFAGTYNARITLDGVAIQTTNSSASAPIFGHARARHSLSFRSQGAKAGQTLRMEYIASHSNPINREVDSEVMNIAYVKTDSA